MVLVATTAAAGVRAGRCLPDSRPFEGTVYNKEYNVFLVLNFYDADVTVPKQEVLGQMDGYIGCGDCNHVWTITTSVLDNDRTARFEATNNYGSEDFTAKLTLGDDGTYTLRHTGGSTLKFPVGGKWRKLPSKVTFTR